MDKTLNQIKSELQEIASQHRQINSFFWGDFVDAINRDAVDYPIMVCTLQPGSMGDGFINVNLSVVIADKYNEQDYRQIDEVHNDTLLIGNDFRITLKQERFADILDIDGDITLNPFINRGADMTAGWELLLNLQIYDNEDYCSIPYDNYDFKN